MVLYGHGKSNMVFYGMYDLVWSCLVYISDNSQIHIFPPVRFVGHANKVMYGGNTLP